MLIYIVNLAELKITQEAYNWAERKTHSECGVDGIIAQAGGPG